MEQPGLETLTPELEAEADHFGVEGLSGHCNKGLLVEDVENVGRVDCVHAYTWVVVNTMVPFWIPIIIRHLIFRVPKKEP